MNRIEVVLDTNVAVTANFMASQADLACEEACIRAIRQVQAERRTLLDNKGLILEEYRRNLSHSGQPGLGDAFFKWLWENQAHPQRCRIVPVTVDASRGFAEFPKDPRLSTFDRSDRKFVAVVRASGTLPDLMNATDRDWWYDRQALKENGVNVVFLCPELVKRVR